MSWEKTLLDASFRGVVFDCMRTQDNAQRDTTSHEYPYKDGADVEDLGRKARQIAISAVFFGNDYELRLQKFIAELDKPGAGELIHPVFGSIKQAQLLSYSIGHDGDSPDYCTVDLQFVEATPGNPFFVRQLPAQRAAAVSLLAGTARLSAISAFAGKLGSLKSMAGNLAGNLLSPLTALRGVLTGTLGAIRSQITGFVGSGLDMLNFPRAFAGDLVGMVSGLVDLRGFDVSTLKSDWKSLAGQLKGIVKLPARVSSGAVSTTGSSTWTGGGGGSSGSGSSGTPGSGSGGAPGSGSSGGTPVADAKPLPAEPEHVALVTALVQTVVATELAETAASIFTDEAEEPTLSPAEIEEISNDVRESLQQSIDAWRDLLPVEEARPVTEALKDAALGVQQAAAAVIDVLPPLVTRRVEAPGNLHLVAFRWYGDYSRAGELARLNPTLINPNALRPGDTLYAYAR